MDACHVTSLRGTWSLLLPAVHVCGQYMSMTSPRVSVTAIPYGTSCNGDYHSGRQSFHLLCLALSSRTPHEAELGGITLATSVAPTQILRDTVPISLGYFHSSLCPVVL